MAITRTAPTSGYLGRVPTKPVYPVMLNSKGTELINRVIVYEFTIPYDDDPHLTAAEPLIKWECSEMGKWVIEHSVETPQWNSYHEFSMYATNYCITACLKETDLIYFTLKWK